MRATAVEQYKTDNALMLQMAAQSPPSEHWRQYPFDDYVIAMLWLMDVLARNPSHEELGQALMDRRKRLDAARETYRTSREASIAEAERQVRKGNPPAG